MINLPALEDINGFRLQVLVQQYCRLCQSLTCACRDGRCALGSPLSGTDGCAKSICRRGRMWRFFYSRLEGMWLGESGWRLGVRGLVDGKRNGLRWEVKGNEFV
jgi:hypothetical protein